MMTITHSIWQWKTDRWGHIVLAEGCVPVLTYDSANDDIDVSPANAALIAAAPALLEACRFALDDIDYLQNLWGKEGITDHVADRLRVAIAKATKE